MERHLSLPPSFSLSLTLLLGHCESMPSAAQSMQHYYVVVTEIWTGEPVRGSHRCWNPFHLTSGSCNGLLFYVSHFLLSLLFSLCLPFFLPRSHRETADRIEAVASRAVRASKQTLGFLMDLLQDNSTEEYIRNLTEQWAQQRIQTHAYADEHKQNECLPFT